MEVSRHFGGILKEALHPFLLQRKDIPDWGLSPQEDPGTGGRPCSPGLLIYMWMGFLLLSDCRNSSCAMTRLATLSSICKWGGEGCPQIGMKA